MPWTEDLRSDVLEEFGQCGAPGGGEENVWLAQASAMREYKRQKDAKRVQTKITVGECFDCHEKAASGKRRCATHLATRNANTIAYLERAKKCPISEATKIAMAAASILRRMRKHMITRDVW